MNIKLQLTECIFLTVIQISQCQDRMIELEKMIENPHDESRVRFLEGHDPTPAQLQNKLEEVCVCVWCVCVWYENVGAWVCGELV